MSVLVFLLAFIGLDGGHAEETVVAGHQETREQSVLQTEILPSKAVEPGVLAGVVLDSATAEPLAGVGVVFRSTSSDSVMGVLTDEHGRFAIHNLPVGDGTLLLQLVGFATERRSIAVKFGTGYVARFVLRSRPIDACLDYLRPPPAVTVVIRDALTGHAPEVAMKLVVRDQTYQDSAIAPVPDVLSDSQTVLRAARGRAGTYHIEITGPGYHSWRVDNFVVRRGSCGDLRPRTVKVWLLPEH